ncbi:MAG TPA: epoxide hydrolase N-terminal domain-containing protein [Roseateles sp.]
MSAAVRPFRIDIPQAAVDDLRQRLRQARWPQAVAEDWTGGQPVAFVRELADQWLNDYDWRRH